MTNQQYAQVESAAKPYGIKVKPVVDNVQRVSAIVEGKVYHKHTLAIQAVANALLKLKK